MASAATSRSVRLSILLGAAALSAPAFSQQTGQIPNREQVELPAPDDVPTRPRIRIDSGDAVESAPCPLDRFDLNVAITSVQFNAPEGGELAPEIRALLAGIGAPGGEASIAVVCDIRDRATAALRNAGYVASVQIPPQTITGGDLRLEVVTARIVEMRVRGDAAPYRDTLTARAEQLKSLDPLNERDAERILLLAGDIPGLDVQLALSPAGTRPGEVIGELTVVYRPYSLLANVQNYGSRQLGRETGYARAEVYGLTGLSDVTYIGGSTTVDFEEQKVAQIGHITGLGNTGLTLGGSFIYAWSKPDIGLLDLRSESLIGGLELTLPLVRDRRQSVAVTGGVEIIEQRTRVYANDVGLPLNRDKLRVAFVRAQANLREPLAAGGEAWSLQAALELRQGLDILNATERGVVTPGGFTPSRIEGDPTAFVAKAELGGVVALGPIFSLAARGEAQWANNPLLNFEEYSLGNLTIGRGYDPGANSADRAVALRAEARAKIYDSPAARVELFGFYDSVWIWNLDLNSTENDRRLASWGGGLRALIAPYAYLEAMYAHPEDLALLIPNARRSTDRVLLSLTVQFTPGAR